MCVGVCERKTETEGEKVLTTFRRDAYSMFFSAANSTNTHTHIHADTQTAVIHRSASSAEMSNISVLALNHPQYVELVGERVYAYSSVCVCVYMVSSNLLCGREPPTFRSPPLTRHPAAVLCSALLLLSGVGV